MAAVSGEIDPQAYGIENTFHVQVHNLAKCLIRMCIEFFSPGGARIGEQDIDMVGSLLHLPEQVFHAFNLAAVCRHRDGTCTSALGREVVQGIAGSLTGLSFSRRNVDSGAAGLQATGTGPAESVFGPLGCNEGQYLR